MRRRWLLLALPAALVGTTFAVSRPAYDPVAAVLRRMPQLREVARSETPQALGTIRTGPMPLADALSEMDRLAARGEGWVRMTPGYYFYSPPPPLWSRVPLLGRLYHPVVAQARVDDGIPINMDSERHLGVPKGPYATLNLHRWRADGPMMTVAYSVGSWTVTSPRRLAP